jgi:uridine phosphorylase
MRHSAKVIAPSELVLNADRSVYHLGLRPLQLADTIIVVGDQHRVPLISRHFDIIEHKVQNREFCTHTGTYKGKRITALSTGIGVDNVDIVMNELDALVNIDLNLREIKPTLTSLRIVRLGTSGALNADIPVGSFVHSRYAVGLDGVMHYYDARYDDDEIELTETFRAGTNWRLAGIIPYSVRSDDALGQHFQKGYYQGITVTACGFYGPQGRVLRLPVALEGLNEAMSNISFRGIPVANYEMESSALFGLGAMMGHACTTVCTVVANRMRNEFLSDHHTSIEKLIQQVLDSLSGH